MKQIKRLSAMLLCAAMALALFCLPVYADYTESYYAPNGICWYYSVINDEDGEEYATLGFIISYHTPTITHLLFPETLGGVPLREICGDYNYRNFYNGDIYSATIPSSVRRVGMFFHDFALQTVTFMDGGLEEIGHSAFENCRELQSVVFPENCEFTIGEDAFLDCRKLMSVDLPKGVTAVGDYAFGYTSAGENGLTLIPGFTIYGWTGSAVQIYAVKNGINFVSTGVLEGKPEARSPGMKNFLLDTPYTYGQFTDVNEDAWYGANRDGSVRKAYQLGIVSGKGGGIFDPDGSISLAEVLKMVVVVHDIYQTGGTTDFTCSEGEIWYSPYIMYAQTNGLIQDKDRFDWWSFREREWDEPATRAQVAVLFSRALPESELSAINDMSEGIPDVFECGEGTYNYDEIMKLYAAGVLTGSDDYGRFHPGDNITRAAAAALIVRVALPEERLTLDLKHYPKPADSGSYVPGMFVETDEQFEQVFWDAHNSLYPRLELNIRREVWESTAKALLESRVPMGIFGIGATKAYSLDSSASDYIVYVQPQVFYSFDFSMERAAAVPALGALLPASYRDYIDRLDAIAAQIITPGMTDREKVTAIHDYMVRHYSYDTTPDLETMDSYSFYGLLMNGKGVCDGYSQLFDLLCAKAGVLCEYVSGTANGYMGRSRHRWNRVLIDDVWLNVDVTFDDPIPDGGASGTVSHKYLLVDDAAIARDHFWK